MISWCKSLDQSFFWLFCSNPVHNVFIIDIDECAQKTDVCVKQKSVCHNIPGSYECICKPGFEPKSHGSRVCVGKFKALVILYLVSKSFPNV